MLEDPENHRAAAAALPPRQVGSTATSAKTTRTPFTAEDDRVLLDWVNRDVNAGRAAGNAMYQELGEKVRAAFRYCGIANRILRTCGTHGKLGEIATSRDTDTTY